MDFSFLKYRYSSEKDINWGELVPEITFVLYLCGADKEHIDTKIIADQATSTYPNIFLSEIGKKKIADTYIVVMTLKEAKSNSWRYVKGDWVKGWKLTQKGVQFAKEVERRKLARYKK